MKFEDAVEFVLEQEGGYVNDPMDPGGETAFGISKRAYPHLDLRTLTREEAIAIYRVDFWEKLHCDELPAGLDLLVFDAAVNEGQPRAARILQHALRVREDGIVGPETIAAAGKHTDIVLEFAANRMFAYGLIPQFIRYGLGWSRRLMRATALAIAAR